MVRRRLAPSALLAIALLSPACDGPQSALAPAGRDAARIADLFWWMTAGAAVVWLGFVGLTIYAVFVSPRRHDEDGARGLIVGLGVVLPTAVLAVLLAFGLAMLPDLLRPAPAGSLRIQVSGEQFWWRIRYLAPDGAPVDVANELHLPVGEPVELELHSPDVIHSFWIPALGGKVDMIPGRRTRLRLEPTRTGVFRGVCAEYCGASHAFMAFPVVIHERPAFDRWLAGQAAPARPPTAPLAQRGAERFLASGCGACHTVRGTAADGVVGPDLTHVGGRRTLAAGRLGNQASDLRRWVAHPAALKPGVTMPRFDMLPADDLAAIAAYLEGLK
jgi:cytochrome c oxidase subunit II